VTSVTALTSLDVSVVELGLVAMSSRQLHFSSNSNYNTFSAMLRNQEYNQFAA
jgi:hypothetical protein